VFPESAVSLAHLSISIVPFFRAKALLHSFLLYGPLFAVRRRRSPLALPFEARHCLLVSPRFFFHFFRREYIDFFFSSPDFFFFLEVPKTRCPPPFSAVSAIPRCSMEVSPFAASDLEIKTLFLMLSFFRSRRSASHRSHRLGRDGTTGAPGPRPSFFFFLRFTSFWCC